MWSKIRKLFISNPDFLCITLGSVLSTVGMALTGIAVYSELSSQGAPTSFYTLAFALELLPALLSGYLARKYFQGLSIHRALVSAEVIGGFGVLVPLLGVAYGSLPLLLVALTIGSAVSGFLLPFQNTHMRRALSDEDLQTHSFLTSFVFGATFILGTILGSVLYAFVGTEIYLVIDSLTYFVSVGLTLCAKGIRPHNFGPIVQQCRDSVRLRWATLTSRQKKAFSLNLVLAVNCAPATAVLPSLAGRFDLDVAVGPIVLASVLVLLVLKQMGQLLGPFLISHLKFDELLESNYLIAFCLLIFHTLYFVILTTDSLWVLAPLVVIAHMFSNVVFILAFYALPRFFSDSEIGVASSLQHQMSIMTIATIGLISGALVESWGYQSISLLSVSVYLIYVVGAVWFSLQPKRGVVHEA